MKQRTTIFLLLLEELIKELNWNIEVKHDTQQLKIDRTIIITPTIENTWKIENEQSILQKLSIRDALEECVKHILIKRTEKFNKEKETFGQQVKEAIKEWHIHQNTRYKSAIIENGSKTIPYILDSFEQYPKECNELLKIITGFVVNSDNLLEEWIKTLTQSNDTYSEISLPLFDVQ
jgi:hypothetical protein